MDAVVIIIFLFVAVLFISTIGDGVKRQLPKGMKFDGWLKLDGLGPRDIIPKRAGQPVRVRRVEQPGEYWFCDECAHQILCGDSVGICKDCAVDECDSDYYVPANYNYYNE
jgi:hypothetical protein